MSRNLSCHSGREGRGVRAFGRGVGLLVAAVIAMSAPQGVAKDFGTAGQTFHISEEHLIDMIQRKIQDAQDDGRIAALQEEMRRKTRERVQRPSPVDGMSAAVEYHSYTYDPTVSAAQDYRDLDGKIVVAKGMTVNPFDLVSLSSDLLFINGDREAEVEWAFSETARRNGGTRIILVDGVPLKIMRERKVRVYFDQNGALSRQLDIIKTPSRVTQKDRLLFIEEIPVDLSEGGS